MALPCGQSPGAWDASRGVREAPVAGAQVEDVCGGLMAYGQARVYLKPEAVEVVVEKFVEGSRLIRKAGNEHVVCSSGCSRDRRAGGIRDRCAI